MKTVKNVLLLNSISSGLTGLLLMAMPATIAALFDVSQQEPFLATGTFLVLFALLVYYASGKQRPATSLLSLIISLDCMWVVASLLVVAGQLFGLSFWGYLLISAVALWVGLMAYLQYSGLRKMTAESES